MQASRLAARKRRRATTVILCEFSVPNRELNIPVDAISAAHEDVSAWAAACGVDLRLMPGFQMSAGDGAADTIRYVAQLDDSFFDAYPRWREYLVK